MYADDTTIYAISRSVEELQTAINSDAENISDWFSYNRLMINVSKSFTILVCPYQKYVHLPDRNMNVTLLNTELATVDSLKLLGINIDNNLSWQTHIDIVQKRLVSLIGLMYRIRMFLDEKNMILFYHAHFLPVIDYCINIWGHAAKVHIKKIQVLQNRAARIILNADWNESSLSMLNKLKWMSIKDRIFYSTCLLMYKVTHNDAPDYLYVFMDRQIEYNLPGNHNIVIPHPNINLYKRSFMYQGASCWNELPENVKSCQTLSSFKVSIKNYILNNRRS